MARTGFFLYEHGRLLLLVSLFGFKVRGCCGVV